MRLQITCKKISEEFIYSKGEFLVTIIGFEIHFSSNGDSIHIDLYKHMMFQIYQFFTITPLLWSFIWWLGSWLWKVSASEIFPERTDWRPPNNRSNCNSAFCWSINRKRIKIWSWYIYFIEMSLLTTGLKKTFTITTS